MNELYYPFYEYRAAYIDIFDSSNLKLFVEYSNLIIYGVHLENPEGYLYAEIVQDNKRNADYKSKKWQRDALFLSMRECRKIAMKLDRENSNI